MPNWQGGTQLDAGVSTLTEGLGALGSGVRTMAAQLPADAQLDALREGGETLTAGSARLSEGIRLVNAALPDRVDARPTAAPGLADSVEPELKTCPVPNNGSALCAQHGRRGAVDRRGDGGLSVQPQSGALQRAQAPRLPWPWASSLMPAASR